MITTRNIGFNKFFSWTWKNMVASLIYAALIAILYKYDIITISLPWLPISIIGTAVAFYVGFKNNQAYDRIWEARKIWGAIINSSRTWGMFVNSYITNEFSEKPKSEIELQEIKLSLIKRHIAWLYALRSQLLVPQQWEHLSQDNHLGRTAKSYQKKYGLGLIEDEITNQQLHRYLPDIEYDSLKKSANMATQIINNQAKELVFLRKENVFEDFRHIDFMKVLSEFYNHQGAAERIKKFPLPRIFTTASQIFVYFFILLFPFSMIPEMINTLGNFGFWISIPLVALISFFYFTMENIGDFAEFPFMGIANDIPMYAICRTIEIDLLQQIGEDEVPKPIESVNGILM